MHKLHGCHTVHAWSEENPVPEYSSPLVTANITHFGVSEKKRHFVRVIKPFRPSFSQYHSEFPGAGEYF